jgi:hypothetical protein
MLNTTRTLAQIATGLPGADDRHRPDIWTDLLAVWRDHGMPAAAAAFPPSTGHPAAPRPPLPVAETQWRV